MSERAAKRQNSARPSVALSVLDPLHSTALTVALEAAGYDIVSVEMADTLLCEGEPPRTDVPALVLGASRSEHAGALPIDATPEQIAAALHAISLGLIVRSPSRSFAELRETSTQGLLTPRELQVLAAISDGASNKAIARQLGISLHTVKFHIESLFRKLGARSRAEAVAKGMERVRDIVEI
jgi:DNA-binding CsgD family transcriptional regulator